MSDSTLTFVVTFNNPESAKEFQPPFPHVVVDPILSISTNVVCYDVEVADAELAFRVLTSEWYCGDLVSLHVLPNVDHQHNWLVKLDSLRSASYQPQM